MSEGSEASKGWSSQLLRVSRGVKVTPKEGKHWKGSVSWLSEKRGSEWK